MTSINRLGLAFGACAVLSACYGERFDEQRQTQVYGAFVDASLEGLELTAENCSPGFQSSVLAHLLIAGRDRVQNQLFDLYDGRFAEESSAFKFYQRSSGPSNIRTVGYAEEIETATTIVQTLRQHNIVLTAIETENDANSSSIGTFYVDNDGNRELVVAGADQDWFFGGLPQSEWIALQNFIENNALPTEPGVYVVYDDVFTERAENNIAITRLENDANFVTTRRGTQAVALPSQCEM
jgi:hypothetical protein